MDRGDVFAECRRWRLFLVALSLERGGNDVALLLRQGTRILATSTTTAATTTLLVLAIVAPEWPHRHEVDVRGRFLSFGCAAAIPAARVVRNHVTRLEAEFFEEERVAGDEIFLARSRAVIEQDRLFSLAVD